MNFTRTSEKRHFGGFCQEAKGHELTGKIWHDNLILVRLYLKGAARDLAGSARHQKPRFTQTKNLR